jgi:hypothetical protein
MRIGKTPKNLASICCPQRRETKADTLKATEANRRRGPGTRENIRPKRVNLEGLDFIYITLYTIILHG